MKFWRCLPNNIFFFFNHSIPCYFKLHILLALTHSLFLFHIFSLSFSNFPNPPPLQVCGYVCAGSRLQQFSSAAQSAHERCGSLQRHHTGTAHLTFSHSRTPHAAGRLHTLVKLVRFILINGRHLLKKTQLEPFWIICPILVVNANVIVHIIISSEMYSCIVAR